MIGVLAADELDPARFANALEIGPGQFQGGFHRFGAAAGEKGAGQIAGGQGGDLFRQADGGLGGRPHRHIGDFEHLLIGGVGDFGLAVADIFQPQAGHSVNVGLAQGIGNLAALAFDENLRLSLFRHIAGFPQIDPQVFQGGALQLLNAAFGMGGHHKLPSAVEWAGMGWRCRPF